VSAGEGRDASAGERLPSGVSNLLAGSHYYCWSGDSGSTTGILLELHSGRDRWERARAAVSLTARSFRGVWSQIFVFAILTSNLVT
jgi:hypothetical protein